MFVDGRKHAKTDDQSGITWRYPSDEHLYYMIDRIKTGEDIHIELNEFVQKNYPKAWEVSRKVCLYVFEKMKAPISEKEVGFFAVHIQTIVNIR